MAQATSNTSSPPTNDTNTSAPPTNNTNTSAPPVNDTNDTNGTTTNDPPLAWGVSWGVSWELTSTTRAATSTPERPLGWVEPVITSRKKSFCEKLGDVSADMGCTAM
ncbi:hypothetical protein FKW77_005141 [Venturia effusa]|uniref:Uncharacterized protein n=1 Tax=Venturia effusa TaxID=50376 RepID=A0A517LH61_9PEZI|nr:hypothetical protein FKW77_005141 [Venturia effusa]